MYQIRRDLQTHTNTLQLCLTSPWLKFLMNPSLVTSSTTDLAATVSASSGFHKSGAKLLCWGQPDLKGGNTYILKNPLFLSCPSPSRLMHLATTIRNQLAHDGYIEEAKGEELALYFSSYNFLLRKGINPGI